MVSGKKDFHRKNGMVYVSKHQNKKRSDLPRYLIKEIQPIEREAWVKLRIGHYEEALQLYSDEYQ
jgi:hypothetical protein